MLFIKRLVPLLWLTIYSFAFSQTDWVTLYEKSNKLETPRYNETMDYFQKLASYSPFADMYSIGKSPEGRDINIFVISSDKALTAQQARKTGKPIVLIQNCIHPGESAGKDASMMLARDILVYNKYQSILDNVILVIIPIFNVDGHEHFSPYNRINQVGPKEMGWRVTADRLNLNRDYMKVQTPEMQHWMKMFNQWKHHVIYDCHTTDGRDHQYAITYKVNDHVENSGEIANFATNQFMPYVLKDCLAKGVKCGLFYGLLDNKNPELGVSGGIWPPKLSNAYLMLRNCLSILIETHSLKTYAQRTDGTYHFLRSGLGYISTHSNDLFQAIESQKKSALEIGKEYDPNNTFTIKYKTRKDVGDSMLYDAFEIKTLKSKISGSEYLKYTDKKKTYSTILYNRVESVETTSPPVAYIIPSGWYKIIEILDTHGIHYKKIKHDVTDVFETYMFKDVSFRPVPYEGVQIPYYNADKISVKKTIRPGDVYVPVSSEESRLVLQLLEPLAEDSIVKWGFVNTIFEQKEYYEKYAMEPLAQKMLNEDESLKKEFEERLKNDPEFAANPKARLNFFYERSPYWDKQQDQYPVLRVIKPIDQKYLE